MKSLLCTLVLAICALSASADKAGPLPFGTSLVTEAAWGWDAEVFHILAYYSQDTVVPDPAIVIPFEACAVFEDAAGKGIMKTCLQSETPNLLNQDDFGIDPQVLYCAGAYEYTITTSIGDVRTNRIVRSAQYPPRDPLRCTRRVF